MSYLSKHTFLATLSGVLLALAWPPLPYFPLIFFAFIPLLVVENQLCKTSLTPTLSFFKYAYLTLLIWNLITTWWIANASTIGAMATILFNPLLMSIPFILFHFTKKQLGSIIGKASLIFYFISFEFIHLRWDIAWPWLTLGNVFANFPKFFQWYEFTGVLGGTIWILLINILLIHAYENYTTNRRQLNQNLLTTLAILIIPIAISYTLYNRHQEKGVTAVVSLVQPNFNPYAISNEETFDNQWKQLFKLVNSFTTDSTDIIVFPEAVIPGEIWLDNIKSSVSYQRLLTLSQQYKLTVIAGIFTLKKYNSKATPSARNYRNGQCCYDIFNSAVQINDTSFQIHHKSKLVPGVEKTPFHEFFDFLNPILEKFGGAAGFGKSTQATVFTQTDFPAIAPVICYESVFGKYVTDYINQGAQSIFILTNDGWWGNTPGYRQHLAYASLRAVETRRSIARCANTGISCFINQRGDILKTTEYDKQAVLQGKVRFNQALTFYAKHGDYVGRICVGIALLLLLITFIKTKIK